MFKRNITCRCRFRHPADRTCEEAKRLADEAKKARCNCVPRCPSEFCTGCCPCCRRAGREQNVIHRNLSGNLEDEVIKLRTQNIQFKNLLRSRVTSEDHLYLGELLNTEKEKSICGKPTEGHQTGKCTLLKDHDNYCWFPNMYNDM
jgi:hypothetical protein